LFFPEKQKIEFVWYVHVRFCHKEKIK
jgi:hypothetical protein